MQILVRQGHVYHQFWLDLPDQRHQFRHVVSIHLCGVDAVIQLCGNGIALGFCSRSQGDAGEDVAALGAFVGNNLADTAGTDDKDCTHGLFPPALKISMEQLIQHK